MSMTENDHAGEGLDLFFEAARDQSPAPSPDLLARVLVEAESVQASHAVRVPKPRLGMAAHLYRLLGGWPAMAGLATAALTGIWIGAGLPEGLFGKAEAAYLLDITPEMAFDLAGGDF